MKIITTKVQHLDNHHTHDILRLYGMKSPTDVKLHLCDRTLHKMRQAIILTNSHQFNNIDFISTTREDFEHCLIELFADGEPIPISHYEDFDRTFPSFDSKHFKISCSSFYANLFTVQFIFSNAYSEVVFRTENFQL